MVFDGQKLLFFGHDVEALAINGLWALTSFLILLGLIGLRKGIKWETLRNKVGSVIVVLILIAGSVSWLLFLPNSFYLCLEIRHIIQADTIADNREPLAVIGFGILSLLGLAFTIAQIYICAIQIRIRNNLITEIARTVVILGLSFDASWGSVFGWVTNFNSWEMSFLGIITLSIKHYTPDLGLLVAETTLGLSVISYGAVKLKNLIKERFLQT